METSRSPFSRCLAVAPLAGLLIFPLTTACGGKGGKAPAATSTATPPTAVENIPEGMWEGTLKPQDGETMAAEALVLANGEVRIIIPSRFLLSAKLEKGQAKGHCHALGMNRLKGEARTEPVTITVATHQPKVIFSGQYKKGDESGRFTFDKYLSSYDKAINPAVLIGDFSGNGEIRTIRQHAAPQGSHLSFSKSINLHLGSDGSLSGGQKDSFHIQGTYKVPDPDKAGIEVAFTYTPLAGMVEQFQGVGMLWFNPKVDKYTVSFSAMGEHDGLFNVSSIKMDAH
jgi:hypothetical protein